MEHQDVGLEARTVDARYAPARSLDTLTVSLAGQAVKVFGGVVSPRGTTIFTGLKTKLTAHQNVPAVRDFLDSTR